jgi:hypothetical protein
VCVASGYDFIVITVILSFQTLQKWAGAAEIEGTEAGGGGHPEGAIDIEIARILSELWWTPMAYRLRRQALAHQWL